MECQPGVIPVCCRVLSDLCTPLLLQINTHSQQELTEAGTTYNKWQFTITMARAYLTTTAHGSNFHVMPSCYVQSGIHLPGRIHTDADITKLTCKHLIPQSYVYTEAVPVKCWQKQQYYSCIFFIVVFQRELILKAIFLLRDQIVHRKLSLPSLGDDWLHLLLLAATNGRISYVGGEKKKKGSSAHKKKDVLWKMSVKFHILRMMKVAAVLPGGGEIEMWCVFVEVQRGRGNVLWC